MRALNAPTLRDFSCTPNLFFPYFASESKRLREYQCKINGAKSVRRKQKGINVGLPVVAVPGVVFLTTKDLHSSIGGSLHREHI